VFTGNQGSGKSTVAKLISAFTWMEKVLVRGDYSKDWFEENNKFLNYHRIENYLHDGTVIEYEGDVYSMKYNEGFLSIEETGNTYPLPQIMYAPAERNFITSVKTPKEWKLSSDALKEFLAEFERAKNEMKGMLPLPVNNVSVEYDTLSDTLNLKGKDYMVKLAEASSGFQSLVPLYVVSHYLSHSVRKQTENKEPMSDEETKRFKKGVADIWENDDLTDEQKRSALSVLASKFNKTAFINIVEEPEQNLFPLAQWQLLQSLLEFNNMSAGNKLIITTHSPYLINFLSIAIQGEYLKTMIEKSPTNSALYNELKGVVSENSLISSDSVTVYQFDENTGAITKLPSTMGIPSDDNYLNDMLRNGNQMFDKLLEIEEKLQQ
jgi:predicted ATPase